MRKLSRPTLGWVFYDFANSAFATIILAVIFNRYFAEVIAGGREGTLISLPWGDYNMHGAAVWTFLVAFSTAIVAVSSPLLGAIADQAGLRKRMLVVFCYFGVAATIGLSWVGEGDLVLACIIFLFANLGFAGGNVFYNAFLLDVSERKSFGRISGLAWGFGYLGGGLCLVLNLIMLQKPQLLGFAEGSFDIGDCIIVAGIWWGIFALPTSLWLKDRGRPERRASLVELTVLGWRRLTRTFREVRRYRQLVRFLIAFLIFNDGVETVIIMASIFGAEVVGLSIGELIGFFIMVQATGLIGSLFFGWLADIITNKRALMITLVMWIGVVAWAFQLGWLTDMRLEFYLLGIVAGLAMGGSQAISRSMQAAFTPRDRSAEFFGFWALSGRFASIFGPLFYGGAILLTGSVRSGILILGLFFIVGGIILYRVDETEGIQAALEDSY